MGRWTNVGLMLAQPLTSEGCWHNVCEAGPILKQRCFSVLCWLELRLSHLCNLVLGLKFIEGRIVTRHKKEVLSFKAIDHSMYVPGFSYTTVASISVHL